MRCLLLSDYALQTTNLARAAALQFRATGVGRIFSLDRAAQPAALESRLSALITSEGLDPAKCTAAVAGLRDIRAAKKLGLGVSYIYSDAKSLAREIAGHGQPPIHSESSWTDEGTAAVANHENMSQLLAHAA